jgi:hypothetical protein
MSTPISRDGKPETQADVNFFGLRGSGYTGWIDAEGHSADCPFCHQPTCTAELIDPCNGRIGGTS